MKVILLPFGKITILESQIAEIIINEGVILDEPEVDAYQSVLKSLIKPPYFLLINKINAYSYTFDAQLAMGKYKANAFTAVVVYSVSAEMATQILKDINKDHQMQMELFRDRASALDWLLMHQNNKSVV